MKNIHAVALALTLASCIGTAQAAPTYNGPQELQTIRSLAGTWDAQTKQGTMTDVFVPFDNGNYVLGEELLNGKQITSTVFYVVGNELRADHYCDFGNQPRYTAKPTSDPSTIDFAFRDVTDLDVNPAHFHSTTWHVVDPNHLIQDWYVEGGRKGASAIRMTFAKRA